MKRFRISAAVLLLLCLGLLRMPAAADRGGPDAESGTAWLTEETSPVITVQPADYEGSIGETAVFSVRAEGTGLSYQWQARTANGTKWSDCSCVTDSYRVKISEARLGYVYRCRITDAGGSVQYSAEVRMRERASLSILTQPADYEGSIGETAVFSVRAEGTGLSYQWQARTASGTKWNNCSCVTDSYRVKISAARLGYVYRCAVSDASGAVLYSAEARMREAASAFAVTADPADVEANVGDTAVFSVSATGSGLSYQWQLKTSAAAAWKNTTITGYRTDTVTVPVTAARIGYAYRCVVTNAAGETLTSGEARLLEAVPFAITADPADVRANVGDTAVFSVSATGSGLLYQWQLKTSAAAAWKNTTITGYRTDTVTVPVTAARIGYAYRCVVTNAAGETLTSGEARLLEAVPFAITVQPEDYEGELGETAVFAAAAEGAGLSYQWQARTANGTRWSDCSCVTDSFRVKISETRLGYVYRCRITDAGGSVLYSAEVRMRRRFPVVHSGTTTAGLSWTLRENGCFTVSGTGFITDYDRSIPGGWGVYANDITAVVIGDGVTEIGAYAFNGCASLTELSLGSGVTEIGYAAFNGCASLTELSLPDSVTEIGDFAFYGCTALSELELGSGISRIGCAAFYGCDMLKRVEIDSPGAEIDRFAFFGSESITSGRQLIEIEAVIQEALGRLLPGMDDMRKALVLHDWLIVRGRYDYDNALNGTLPPESFDVYGALVRGCSVCQGYADAFRILMLRCGIPCVTVTTDSHAWNQVCIDGVWYNIDTTWDDPVPDAVGQVRHACFLVSDEKLLAMDGERTSHSDPVGGVACTDDRYDSGAFWEELTSPLCFTDADTVWYAAGGGYYYNLTDPYTGLTRRTYEYSLRLVRRDWESGAEQTAAERSGSMPRSLLNEAYRPGSGLGLQGGCLYFNDPEKVLRWDPAAGELSAAAEAGSGSYISALYESDGALRYLLVSAGSAEERTVGG